MRAGLGPSLLCVVALSITACSAPSPPASDVRPARVPTSSVAATPAGVEPSVAPPATTATATPKSVGRLIFSVDRVLADTKEIEHFGVRVPGSRQESAAADYVIRRLRSMGYEVSIEEFRAPAGVSRNVTARVRGVDARHLVVGAHLDTRSTTPGANDDAAGCAIVLELARILSKEKPPVSVEFTLFGSEEYNDGTPRDHHRGSRYHVAHMTKTQREQTIGMISIDVVGLGRQLYVRTMGTGPLSMSDYLRRRARHAGVSLKYLKDPGPTGWSDHEPYEKIGIPAVWIERLQDPQYHKAGDTTEHLRSSALGVTGRLVLDAVRSMDRAEVGRVMRGGAGSGN